MNYYKKRASNKKQGNLIRIGLSTKSLRIRKKMIKYTIMQRSFSNWVEYGLYELGEHRKICFIRK